MNHHFRTAVYRILHSFHAKRLFHLLRPPSFHYNSRRVSSGDAATSCANRKSSDNSLSRCNYPTLHAARAQFRHTRVTDISTPYNSFPVIAAIFNSRLLSACCMLQISILCSLIAMRKIYCRCNGRLRTNFS